VQHREGISSALELTDAEGALRQSEFNYAEAIYDYLVARARLDEAMGTVDIVGRAVTAARWGERQ
jgi:outer membrane protein TolC